MNEETNHTKFNVPCYISKSIYVSTVHWALKLSPFTAKFNANDKIKNHVLIFNVSTFIHILKIKIVKNMKQKGAFGFDLFIEILWSQQVLKGWWMNKCDN